MSELVEAGKRRLDNFLEMYMPSEEIQLVKRACAFAELAHAGVVRKSGEPYITHPIAVACILAQLRLNAETISAALLHDVVEDTSFTKVDIATKFNAVIAELVDGVTKLEDTNDKFANKVATFKKTIAATIHDPRVMIIKLADRLHNLSTLDSVQPEKRRALAQETMQTYVPIGRLLGLTKLADQVELLCLQQLDTSWFKRVEHALAIHKVRRTALQEVREKQLRTLIHSLEFSPQFKFSQSDLFIYQQAYGAQSGLSTLLETIRFELIVSTSTECMLLADHLKQSFHFYSCQDHIQQPLPGGQQFIDLQLFDGEGVLQIRILTPEMRRTGRFGLLADKKSADTARAVIQASLKSLEAFVTQEASHHTSMQDIINYLHHDKIIVYSRDGDAIELPQHATIIDFAYKTSLYLGNHLLSATVDGIETPLNRTLKNGQKVILQLAAEATPNPEWLGYTVTAKARRAIQQHLANLGFAQQIKVGEQALAHALKLYDVLLEEVMPDIWQTLLDSLSLQTTEELYSQIATGHLIPQFIATKLCTDAPHSPMEQGVDLLIKNLNGLSYRFAQCCNPIPGDRIFGHLTRRGVVVHRFSCPHMSHDSHIHASHVAALEWQDQITENVRFSVVIVIHTELEASAFTEIIQTVEGEQAGVAEIHRVKDGTEVHLVVRNRQHLAQILRQIRVNHDFPQITRVLQFTQLG